jgi:hypothetical protein
MISGSPFFLPLILGFFLGIGFIYFILRFKTLKLDRIDDKMLLIRLPLLGTTEAEDPKGYKGIFVNNVTEDMNKIKYFQNLINVDLMLQYANEYNLNYIGTEGDMDNGDWSSGRLAYSTFSKGSRGGYNIYMNPNLDKDSVCNRLSQQLREEIKPEELYMFLLLHEIGHSTKAGNECYITAMINHSLSGGRRSAKRRKILKDIYLRVEKNADDFAIRELLKIRQKGMN